MTTLVHIAWRRTCASDPRWAARSRALNAAHLAHSPLADAVQELLCLCTCERQELYLVPATAADERTTTSLLRVVDAHLMAAGACGRGRRVRRNLDAAEHFLRVAAGLDSRILGESHIIGQVRSALRDAQAHALAGEVIDRLGRRAMRAARTVRAHTPVGRLGHSYATIAADLVLASLDGRSQPRIGIIGSGALARDVADALLARTSNPVVIYARHPKPTPFRTRPLDALADDLTGLDVVIAATSAAAPLITADHRRQLGPRSLIAVDLGVPANIEPAFGDDPRVRLFNVDDFDPTGRVETDALRAADRLVERQLQRLHAEWSTLACSHHPLTREAG